MNTHPTDFKYHIDLKYNIDLQHSTVDVINEIFVSNTVIELDNEIISESELYEYLYRAHREKFKDTISFDDVLTTRQHKFIGNLYRNEPGYSELQNPLIDFVYWDSYIIHLKDTLYLGLCIDERVEDEKVRFYYIYPSYQEVKYKLRDFMQGHFDEWFKGLSTSLIDKYY